MTATGVAMVAATVVTDAPTCPALRGERPLPNRVDPLGRLVATPERGLLMGNRGGRFHGADGTLSSRRAPWVSRRWIICETAFRGRRRTVWGEGYTELFFLDEVTALAAGHRPCFECRRGRALHYRDCAGRMAAETGMDGGVDGLDRVLHRQRLAARAGAAPVVALDDMPDGVVVLAEGEARAVRGASLLAWTPAGWVRPMPRPAGARLPLVTPGVSLAALRGGYRPLWHDSAAVTAPARAGGAGSA